MTKHDRLSEIQVESLFGYEARETEHRTDALRRASERLINDSQELRKRSTELCDRIMRSQSV